MKNKKNYLLYVLIPSFLLLAATAVMAERPLETYFSFLNDSKISGSLNQDKTVKTLFNKTKLDYFWFRCSGLFRGYELYYEREAVLRKVSIGDHIYDGRGTDYCMDIVIMRNDEGRLLYFGQRQEGMSFDAFMSKTKFRLGELMPYVDSDWGDYLMDKIITKVGDKELIMNKKEGG